MQEALLKKLESFRFRFFVDDVVNGVSFAFLRYDLSVRKLPEAVRRPFREETEITTVNKIRPKAQAQGRFFPTISMSGPAKVAHTERKRVLFVVY